MDNVLTEHKWLAIFFPSPDGLMNRYNWIFGLHKLSVESLSVRSLEESRDILESHTSVDSIFFVVDEMSMFPGENWRDDAVRFLKEYDRLYYANPDKLIYLIIVNTNNPDLKMARCWDWGPMVDVFILEDHLWEEIKPMFLNLMNDRKPRRCYT